VKWLDVNKQFGIFSFQRVGVGYQDNVLLFALDASVAVGPLAFSMQALSVGSPLSEFSPVFSLQGPALTFDRPAVHRRRVPQGRETVGTQSFDSYYGELNRPGRDVLAEGAGRMGTDADPARSSSTLRSTCRWAGRVLFVTGLGAGSASTPSSPCLPSTRSALTRAARQRGRRAGQPGRDDQGGHPALQRTFSPLAGQYWVAAGIAFTSFEMIQAQAVVSVSFGVDLQIAWSGLLDDLPDRRPLPDRLRRDRRDRLVHPSTGC